MGKSLTMKMPMNLFDRIYNHDPDVTAEQLHTYIDDDRRGIKNAITSHPNTSANTLDQLSRMELNSSEVENNIAKHKNTSPETLDYMADNHKHNHLLNKIIAQNNNTSSHTLHKIFAHTNPYLGYIIRDILKHPNISSNDLDRLTEHNLHPLTPLTLEGAFSNPNISSNQIEKIYKKVNDDKRSKNGVSFFSREVLTDNPKTPRHIMHKMFGDPEFKEYILKKIKKKDFT